MKKTLHLLTIGCLILLIALLSCGSALAAGSTDAYEKYWRENYALSGRDCGHIGRMTGSIHLICVFVNDSESHWTGPEIDEMYNGLWKDTAYLEAQAARYGVYLKFSSGYFISTVPANQEDRWLDYLLETQFSNPDHDLAALENYYATSGGFNDCPMLFYFNKPGRCYSYMATKPYYERSAEYAIYYPSTMSSDRSPAHELYHLFGAIDLYYPEKVAAAARKRFPQSSMLIGGREIDDLTAYLIGWTDTYSQDAAAFLNDIHGVTRDDAEAALRGQ